MMPDDRHFAQLLQDNAGALAAYARAVAPDGWAVDDAVQETLLRAWKYRDTFRATGSFEGWLIRICRNCLVDLAKTVPIDLTADPPERAEREDESAELYDLLGRLPFHQREVVAVCALLGYDYAGAAELLGLPIGTVRSRLHRARATITGQLDETHKEVSA
jgi:RNA polymerase sigma-70 factor, ECF subfamily